MIWLYPRPWRPTRVQVTWRTWRDLHPLPMAGFDLVEVNPGPWWRRFVWVRPGIAWVSLWFGALSVWWRRETRARPRSKVDPG
jgi:hypothetical protein